MANFSHSLSHIHSLLAKSVYVSVCTQIYDWSNEMRNSREKKTIENKAWAMSKSKTFDVFCFLVTKQHVKKTLSDLKLYMLLDYMCTWYFKKTNVPFLVNSAKYLVWILTKTAFCGYCKEWNRTIPLECSPFPQFTGLAKKKSYQLLRCIQMNGT